MRALNLTVNQLKINKLLVSIETGVCCSMKVLVEKTKGIGFTKSQFKSNVFMANGTALFGLSLLVNKTSSFCAWVRNKKLDPIEMDQ